MNLPTKLVATVGLPRSGKSTLVRELYLPKGWTVVCPDDFRLAIHGERFIATREPEVWEHVMVAIDALLRSGNRVIVDATNTSKSRRAPLIERGAKFILVETPPEVCISRAIISGMPDLIPVIQSMAAKYEPVGEGDLL